MKKSSLFVAKSDIVEYIQSQKKEVFNPHEIDNIFVSNKEYWKLAKSTRAKQFSSFLFNEKILFQANLNFRSRNYTRYIKQNASILDIAGSLNISAYFCHFTSMYIHELTEQIPKIVYMNLEQPPKRKISFSLNQKRIDYAFRQPWRVTNNIARYKEYSIYLLNGMYTNRLGVINTTGSNKTELSVTDLERTIIDITVRPVYAGGVFEVLKAYRACASRLNIARLIHYLKKINYVYPYHQAIGFLLEKAGFSNANLDDFRKLGLKYDFYLTHEMRNASYSNKWHLYFPDGF